MSRAATLLECFADLPDPQGPRPRKHRWLDILVLAICAVPGGAEAWDDRVEFAHARRDWLQERRELPRGLPWADTFRRVFARPLSNLLCDAVVGLRRNTASKTSPQVARSKDHAPQPLAGCGPLALNLLPTESSHKRGVTARQKRAGWDNDYGTR